MIVGHLQVPIGASLLASQARDIIDFVSHRPWPDSESTSDERKKDAAEATRQAVRVKLFSNEMAFVNSGLLEALVADVRHLDQPFGLVVNTRLHTPSVFYLIDRAVRVSHLNFDFPDYGRFEFGPESLILRDLTETDKTLLRLANTPQKITQEDGTVVERVQR